MFATPEGRNRVRIGMLLMGNTYPPDIRIAKEAKVLLGDGHEVFLLCTDKDGKPPAEKVDGVEVRRYGRPGRIASKVSAAVNYATWRSPAWEREIARFVRENGIEALHVHDLPAVASAVAVARKAGIPVVADMHENYPAAITFWDRKGLPKLLQTPARYRAYERRILPVVDRVVAVVDEARDRIIALGAKPERVVVFTNVDEDAPADARWAPDRSTFTIAYAGGFGPHRGLETLARAFVSVRERVPNARLLLMGAGDGESALRELVVALGISDDTEFTGWIGLAEMRRRLAAASVGVVPHERNEHTDSTVPHKLFQYMAMGLPLVVTDCAPLKRIVEETGAGRVARSGDPASLAEAIVQLADENAAEEVSRRGIEAVERRYNLRVEGEHLTSMYRGLAT